jgi:DNA primase
MAYRRDDIERVRAATDLVDLVAEVTKVKRSGRSVMAVCPFHQEKTPSMSIDPARGLYHCFGCGKGGDVFRFVQETQGLDFSDAVELLARRSGITLQRDPEAAKRRGRREALVAATEQAVAFYAERLRSAPDGAGARRYLRGRGYDADVVNTFRLGFSPAAGDELVGHLRSAGIREDVMISAGLAMRNRAGRLYDRFRGRLMFPIFDVRGDAVGFGARKLEGEGPKYLNSPETSLYRKSFLLYGLNWAKSEIVRSDLAVVVEGYTDVIALHRAGLGVAVATCGTALGEEHVDLLRRFSGKVVLMFDGDEAGIGASLRGFERSVPGDLDLRVAVLPAGTDPADVVAAGDLDRLRSAVLESVPLLQFALDRAVERHDLKEPEARGRAVRAAASVVARHPDPVVRHEYAVYVARRTGVDVEVVLPAMRAAAGEPAGGENVPRRERAARKPGGDELAERELLRLALANSPRLRDTHVDPAWFGNADHAAAYRRVLDAVAPLEEGAPPDLGTLLGDDDTAEAALLRELALDPRPVAADPSEVARRVHRGAVDREIDEVQQKVDVLERSGAAGEASELIAQLIALKRLRIELRRDE